MFGVVCCLLFISYFGPRAHSARDGVPLESDPPVSCDESGHNKFPFSYLTHVTLLIPAQGRLRVGSGWLRMAQDLLSLVNSSRASPELVPYIKMAMWFPVFKKRMVPPSLSFYLDIPHHG